MHLMKFGMISNAREVVCVQTCHPEQPGQAGEMALQNPTKTKSKTCIWSIPCNDRDQGLADLLGYSSAGRSLRSPGGE